MSKERLAEQVLLARDYLRRCSYRLVDMDAQGAVKRNAKRKNAMAIKTTFKKRRADGNPSTNSPSLATSSTTVPTPAVLFPLTTPSVSYQALHALLFFRKKLFFIFRFPAVARLFRTCPCLLGTRRAPPTLAPWTTSSPSATSTPLPMATRSTRNVVFSPILLGNY